VVDCTGLENRRRASVRGFESHPFRQCHAPCAGWKSGIEVPGKGSLERIRDWARRIRRDALTLWFACRHPGTPWYAKALGILVVAYALSPIDLIPDFIPVIGWLDEMLLLPALIWVAMRLLPAAVLEASRADAQRWIEARHAKPRSIAGAVAIVAVWLLALGFCGYLLIR
jgi:uncharacterized membrane protein YkvA (DUF1232 family)